MENLFSIPFIILHFSILLIIVMIIITFKRDKKTQLHYVFILDMVAVLIWSLGQLLQVYYMYFNNGDVSYPLITFYFIGVCFLPPFLLFTGIIYYKGSIKLNFKHSLVFIPSLVSLLMAATTEQNKLLIVKYAAKSTDMQLGPYFTFHNIFTYAYIVIGLSYMVYTSLKTSGFFSKQSIMIILGIAAPFSINILSSYRLIEYFPVYITPVAFSAGVILFLFAVLKYDFLNVMPVALDHIFNQLSDGVIIVNHELIVLDYNKTIKRICDNAEIDIQRNRSILEAMQTPFLAGKDQNNFSNALNMVIKSDVPFTFEKTIETSSSVSHLSFVISNVTVNDKYYCTTILVKDITEIRNKMEEIKRNQEILMEKERLASLGNLIGGIAHNLKTPIMTISGVSDTLVSLGKEYLESLNDPSVTKEDHVEIANEIIEWANKVSPYCAYMSEMISAVKGQAVQLTTASEGIFTLKELMSRTRLLMKFELKKFHCDLRENIMASPYSRIKGDISSLVQVFNNIITNAIQAYEGKSGIIDFEVVLEYGFLLFKIVDYGSGMDEKIKSRLFKEMVTTKGKDGTGLGMYMAYSTIRGHFNGDVSFTSEPGKGTAFQIRIPSYKEIKNEA
ncbi:MAG: hypothetical protein JXQ23_02030 [Clostridia bacterium]|nr:hypothetical protein [Clostridia bacterium]